MRLLLDLDVDPVGKPRMTKRDRWSDRPAVLRYRAFCDMVRYQAGRQVLPDQGIHIVFYLPMPRSWSKKKRDEMRGQPHQQKPDRDNLDKALMDALLPEDCTQWDAWITKYWADAGRVLVWNVTDELDTIRYGEHLAELMRSDLKERRGVSG